MLSCIERIIVGLAALIVDANLAVAGAPTIARRLGVSELVIGLTLTSIGTPSRNWPPPLGLQSSRVGQGVGTQPASPSAICWARTCSS